MEMTEKTKWIGLIQLKCDCHCCICSLLMNKIKEHLFEVQTFKKEVVFIVVDFF